MLKGGTREMAASHLFTPVTGGRADAQALVRPSLTYAQDAWRRLKANRTAVISLYIILFIVAVAIAGPLLSHYNYYYQDLTRVNEPPSRDYLLGTDGLGRDILVRILYGARISLLIGFVGAFMNLGIGVIYGGISGFFGGKVDAVMMRIVDILYGIPLMLIVIMLMVMLGPGLNSILVAFGCTYWLNMARLVRGQILSLKEEEYALAARLLGASRWRVLFRHLIPNAIGPIIVTTTLLIPQAIFLEAFLSFIGLGVQVPMASWGTLAADGYRAIRSFPWQLFFPATAISLTILGFNFLGDGLRDALDPRLRR